MTPETLRTIVPISADSHIAEPPNCYVDYIDPAYRDDAPHVERNDLGQDVYVVKGWENRFSVNRIASAGKTFAEVEAESGRFEEVARGSWDPKARLLDQDRDGVGGEIIYPTVGMLLCDHPDTDYKHAAMWAYNRWLQQFCEGAPDRLFGIGQTAVRSVPEATLDFRKIAEMGHKGVMLPNIPATPEDYDDPAFDPLWEAAVDLNLPLSFHVLTGGSDLNSRIRGPKLGNYYGIIRACQDIISMFILGGVFERHPKLRLVCVEADAGWAPHYIFRMEHAYDHLRSLMKFREMARPPREYFEENVLLTFQDDPVAFKTMDMMDPRQLMWANDFPHFDSIWPNSQAVLEKATVDLSEDQCRRILRDNVTELYRLPA
jgi:predicted TIM-barrel fold metal-dependent hydrolase